MSRALGVAVLSLLVACSSAEGTADSGSFVETGGTGFIPDDSGSDTGAPLPDPAWLDLDATLDVAGGALAGASLTVRVYPEDESLGENCEVTRLATAFAPSTPIPDPSVYGWWLLDLEADPGDCAGASGVGDQILLGMGVLHSELAQAVQAEGLADAKDSLYGAYVGFEPPLPDATDVTAYVLGLAGTEADRLGATVAADGGPMPDGSYLITGWFRFPVDER